MEDGGSEEEKPEDDEVENEEGDKEDNVVVDRSKAVSVVENGLVQLCASLSRTALWGGSFGSTALCQVQETSLVCLRMLCVSRSALLNAVESCDGANDVQVQEWLENSSKFVQLIADRIEKYCATRPITRVICLHVFEKEFESDLSFLHSMQTSFVEFVAKLLSIQDTIERAVSDAKRKYSIIFATSEKKRDIRVRNWREKQLGDKILASKAHLVRLQLEYRQVVSEFYNQHRQAIGDLSRRINVLGIDQKVGGHRIKLKPIPYSPRLSALQTDDVALTLERLDMYAALPGLQGKAAFKDYMVSRLLPKERGGPELRDVEQFLDQFHEGKRRENMRLQWEECQTLAQLSGCTPGEILKELKQIEPQRSGIDVKLLQICVDQFAATQQSYSCMSWLRLSSCPDRYPLEIHPFDDNDDDDDDRSKDDSPRDVADMNDNDDDVRTRTPKQAFERLTLTIRQLLGIPGFEKLTIEGREVTVTEVKDIPARVTVLVHCRESVAREKVEILLTKADVVGICELLVAHFDDTAVVEICGQGLLSIFSRDCLNGRDDPLRAAFVEYCGIEMLACLAIYIGGKLKEKKKPDPSEEKAMRSVFGVLASLADRKASFILDRFIGTRSVQLALWVIQELWQDPEVLHSSLVILCSLSTRPDGQGLIGLQRGGEVISRCMPRCPIRRAFQPAHLVACETLANLMLHCPENAAQIGLSSDHAGVRYLGEVVTRVPGNAKVYRMVAVAFSRIARNCPEALFQLERKGVATILYSIHRFHVDTSVMCHSLVALAHALQLSPENVEGFVEEGGILRMREALKFHVDNQANHQVVWRVFLVLSEIVRSREFCKERVLETLLQENIYNNSLRVIQLRALDNRTLFWSAVFLRLSLRVCVMDSQLVAAVWDQDKMDGEALVSSLSLEDGADGVEEGNGDKKSITERAQELDLDFQPLKREKGESIVAFMRRQAAAEKVFEEQLRQREAHAREALLPPFELRQVWRRVLFHLRDSTLLQAVIERTADVTEDHACSREVLKLALTWFEVEPSMVEENGAAAINLCFNILHSCLENPPVILVCCDVLHLLFDAVFDALPEVPKGFLNIKSGKREEQGKATFAENSAFAELYNSMESEQAKEQNALRQPVFIAAWVSKAVQAVHDSRASERLEVACMYYGGGQIEEFLPISQMLACLATRVRSLETRTRDLTS